MRLCFSISTLLILTALAEQLPTDGSLGQDCSLRLCVNHSNLPTQSRGGAEERDSTTTALDARLTAVDDAPMRPRFSIRMLLVLITLAAAACYWWVARPTIVANRFVVAFHAADISTVDQMWAGPQPTDFQNYVSGRGQSQFRLVPALLPRTFHDFWTGTRCIAFQWTFNGDAVNSHMNVVTPPPVIASPLGIRSPAATDDDEFGVEMGSGVIHFDRSLLETPIMTR